jgi:hypothetical protein
MTNSSARGIARVAAFLLAVSSCASAQTNQLRLGIIGADTSHVIQFTRILDDDTAQDHIPGARIVAFYKGGSPDIPASWNRVDGFTKQLQDQYHLKLVDRIQQLCPLVDGILHESNDGRVHLDQFRQASACHKPIFVDKPLASTLADARAIDDFAAAHNIPWFTASSLRFSDLSRLRSPQLLGAFVWSPGPLETHQQLDLSWYGIHGVEMLYTIMGPGVQQVTRTHSQDADVITGVWKDGRMGILRVARPYSSYGAVAFYPNNKSIAENDVPDSYAPLVVQIVKFMHTGVSPVPHQETLDMFKFMDAAQRSEDQGGIPVRVAADPSPQ